MTQTEILECKEALSSLRKFSIKYKLTTLEDIEREISLASTPSIRLLDVVNMSCGLHSSLKEFLYNSLFNRSDVIMSDFSLISERELLRARGIGKTKIAELKAILKEFNIELLP
jgi:DNA-directed RNA polymerase alpha subunit